MAKLKKKPYKDRTDVEKIKSNWNKTRGLFKRKEYSMAIVRSAICVELSANLAIRAEYKSTQSPGEIDKHLMSANGVKGKFQKHLLKITKEEEYSQIIKAINSLVVEVNDERNSVCHSGAFKTKKSAKALINKSHQAIMQLVPIYENEFSIKAL